MLSSSAFIERPLPARKGSSQRFLVVGQPAALALCDRPRSLTQIIPERVHSYRFILQSPWAVEQGIGAGGLVEFRNVVDVVR